MNTKILYFKFKKKNTESHERNCKSKNYENIFNNILNGEKNEEKSENLANNVTKDNKNKAIKKNKIKCISKVNNINMQEAISTNNINNKEEHKNNDINSKEIKNKYKTENNKFENEKTSPYKDNEKKLNPETCKNLRIDLSKPYHLNKKHIRKNITSCNNSLSEEKNKSIVLQNEKKKANNNLTKDSPPKYKKKINPKKKEKGDQKKDLSLINKAKNEGKKNKHRTIVNNMNKFNLSKLENISLMVKKKEKKNSLISKTNRFTKKENTKKIINKKRSSFESKNIKPKNSKKLHPYNYVNKITITNDNINENIKLKNNRKSFNYTLNNDTKSKKLILNNTNSNINININITNINDKNIKKEKDFKFKSKIQKCDTDTNNFNNNITTVNIINNNNNNSNSKKKTNDYRLLFYNHPKKEKYSPYFNKLNSKGIEIQSININLGEETNDEYSKKNLTNDTIQNNIDINSNYFKKKEIEHEKKEAQSEYEHFRDLEDFWSNRSQTSCSCKSGFTVSRKLRSLSRERDKIKLLNKFKKNNEKDIERINDKLLNIVNNFHNNSSIYNLKKNKNRKSLNGMRKNYKINKNKNYNTISAAGDKKMKKKKIK